MNTIFAERLKAALLDRGWSQADLARRTNLDPGHLSRYVHGKITPQQVNFRKILDAFGMTEQEFMSERGHEPDEAQLLMLCEIEVLLGLARRLVEMTRAEGVIGGNDPDVSPEQVLQATTLQAMDDKVATIRQMVRPHLGVRLSPQREPSPEEAAATVSG